MKVLVLPCSLQIGGSEINAVDLAAAVQQRGHDAVLFGRPGPLRERARHLGVRVVDARTPERLRPSPLAALELRTVVRRERPDLVHVYEGYSCTEAFYGVGFRRRTPLVGTLYTMSVDSFVPTAFPVIAGTAELHADLLRGRRADAVFRLDPPVDVLASSPDPADGRRFRAAHGILDHEYLVAIVSRLDLWLKMDSLLDTIDAVGALAHDLPVRLVVVGDGRAREAVARRAEAVNAAHGRPVVLMTGALMDPVPAYRAADVVVGMGTSLLRGMATGRPSVLVGELGYVRTMRPETVGQSLVQGFWGVGDGGSGADRIRDAVLEIHRMPEPQRAALGDFGRRLVVERHGLESSADALLEIYRQVLAWSPRPRDLVLDAARTPGRVLAHKIRHRLPDRRHAQRRLLAQTGSGRDRYEPALATSQPGVPESGAVAADAAARHPGPGR
ncbi:MAG: glycosyltransferase family 4 protein [Mycobacteriales bacterium]